MSRGRGRVGLSETAALVRRQVFAHPELVERIDDLAALPALGLEPHLLEVAIDELVAVGVLTEAADGRLCVHPRAAP